MKQSKVLIGIVVIFMLCACENSEKPEKTEQSKEASQRNIEEQENDKTEGSYNEDTVIDLEGYLSPITFDMDADGDTILWGETEQELSNQDVLYKVFVDGEVKELDSSEQDWSFSTVTDSGKILDSMTDWDAPVEERHAIIEFNPRTEELEEFVMNNDRNDILTPNGTNYTEDSRTYIASNEYQRETIAPYIWKINTNEIVDIDLTEVVKGESQEDLVTYPHYTLTKDASVLYGIIMNIGIVKYDLTSNTAGIIYSSEEIFSHDEKGMVKGLTANDEYLLFSKTDENTTIINYALDLETYEEIEIGAGLGYFPLDDGTVMMFTEDNEFQKFDFETQELETVHKVELEEESDITGFDVSNDGNTLAYVVKSEEGEEDASKMYIWKKK